jgi:CubicO group peptidase (beta-lactamase class C family)
MVFQSGQTLLDTAYGYASLEWSVPLTNDASFEIGSVTKQFTAAAILKLVEEGKLQLEDDFTKYLDFNTGGRKITINQLLDHTSGIASYTEVPEFWDLSMHQHPRDSLLRMVEEEGFLFEPGEALIYNNSAYFFLGLIIEELSGQSYEDYLAEAFFKPLGMEHTYYCSSSEVVEKKAYGYNASPEGLRQKPYLDHTWPYAAGSLCSTTNDLLIWMQALHGGKVLSPEMYTSMITPGTLNNGTSVRYAKGLTHYDHYGHEIISHGGGIHGFLSETRYFPEEDLYIVCLVNTAGPKSAVFFAEALSWELLAKQVGEDKPLDTDISEVAGVYSGQVRGRKIDLEVKIINQKDLRVGLLEREERDTISTYLGNHTWLNGNDIFTFADNVLLLDEVSGYYTLQRQP